MGNLQFFADKDLISSLPFELAENMRRSGIIAPDQFRIQFCGFVSWKQGTAIFMPVNSGVESRNISGAHQLLRVIQRYYNDKSTGVSEGSGEEIIGAVPLSLALQLIDDYLTNGLYVRKVRQHKLNSGKVNWARTISRRDAYPANGGAVYLDLETSHSRYVSDCETARIHASVIREILSDFGEILLGDIQISDFSLEKMPYPSCNREARIVHLDRELSLSFSDRDITLIHSLKRYLKEARGLDDNLVIGTRNFHHVWETMLDSCLPRNISVNSKLPIPYYLQNGEYIPLAQKGQRTDTVIENQNGSKVAVVDAKYYRADDPQSAPGWPDLVKQFFYQKAVQTVYESTEVSLHFVFPGTERKLESVRVGERKTGRTKVLTPVAGYPDILCHYCDPLTLMQSYLRGVKQQALAEEMFDLASSSEITRKDILSD